MNRAPLPCNKVEPGIQKHWTRGERYNWRGEKHGPWRRGTGGLRNRPLAKLPIRYRTVRDLITMLADPLACAVFLRWTR